MTQEDLKFEQTEFYPFAYTGKLYRNVFSEYSGVQLKKSQYTWDTDQGVLSDLNTILRRFHLNLQ